MKAIITILILGFLLLAVKPTELFAGDPNADSLEIGIIEHLNEYVQPGIMLVAENGETVDLKKLIDKPTVLCFVYFECPMLCTPLMNGLSEVIDKTDLVLGKDYQVLTIGFNPEEPLSLAVAKKKNYVKHMKTKEAAEGWKFFVSDSVNIAAATNTFGFRYKRAGNVFLHGASLIFISPEGKITRYLNGTYFLPFEFKLAIGEASKGISGPTINKLLQYCYGYDSQAKRYVLDVTSVGGAIILFILLAIVLTLIIRPAMRKAARQKADAKAVHP
jgi:protein SCO1/2